jgi:site-specific DNA-methyltransferase (adenine-specific)
MERLAAYCNIHGDPSGVPYFSVTEDEKDEMRSVSAAEWDSMRYLWNHVHGLTNVWQRPPLRGAERIGAGTKAAHLNQKPLEFMERIIGAVTEPGDVVWEPFGGLCSASVAAVKMGRKPYAAEMNPDFAMIAKKRLECCVPVE